MKLQKKIEQSLFPLLGLGGFYLKASSEHGVHSPFVFDLVSNCFYDQTKYLEYEALDNYRNELLDNQSTIEVTDFGAGSRVFKANTRKISAIAKNAGISRKKAQLLFRLVRYFQPAKILEIGTSLGLATSALSLGNKHSKIISLEGCPNTISVAEQMFQDSRFGLQKNTVDFVNTEFSSFLETISHQPSTINFIYFDGNHSKKATLEYFEMLLPTITNESIWIFDDIHWSQEMEEAWEIIKKHPKVTVTIDTYQWGIVFFRKEQQKEHFILKTSKPLSSKLFSFFRLKM